MEYSVGTNRQKGSRESSKIPPPHSDEESGNRDTEAIALTATLLYEGMQEEVVVDSWEGQRNATLRDRWLGLGVEFFFWIWNLSSRLFSVKEFEVCDS